MKFNPGDLVRIKNRGDGWDGVLCLVERPSWNEGCILKAIDRPPLSWMLNNSTYAIGSWGYRYLEPATVAVDETEAFFV